MTEKRFTDVEIKDKFVAFRYDGDFYYYDAGDLERFLNSLNEILEEHRQLKGGNMRIYEGGV